MILAGLTGLIIVSPNIYLIFGLGSDYKGINFAQTDSENLYVAHD